jgi:sugar/nucleoside kinase (ribokinase family)
MIESMQPPLPHYLIAGQLTRDYILLPTGEALLDSPGGNALYAAVGLAVWVKESLPAILARVGKNYPREWLDKFTRKGLDVRGIHILDEEMDLRTFNTLVEASPTSDDPVVHFARHGLPFPKALLGYRKATPIMDSRTRILPISVRVNDLPVEYLGASIAHLCPMDYLTHNLLPAALRQAGFTIITLDPSPGYMNSAFLGDMRSLLAGITAFLVSEVKIRALFQNQKADLWEMAETLAGSGCEIIVIKRGEHGQLLYDAGSHSKWEIPTYPARFANPLGAGDAFCGGFLAGYHRTYNPLEAVLYGNISASLVIEGYTATYALDVLPGLPEARLESLRQAAHIV